VFRRLFPDDCPFRDSYGCAGIGLQQETIFGNAFDLPVDTALVMTLSPRCSACSIFTASCCFLRCGRIVKKYIKPKSMTMKMRNGRRLVHGLTAQRSHSHQWMQLSFPRYSCLLKTINPSKAAIIPKLRIFVFRKSRLLH